MPDANGTNAVAPELTALIKGKSAIRRELSSSLTQACTFLDFANVVTCQLDSSFLDENDSMPASGGFDVSFVD